MFKSENGASAVEFAIVAPLLFVLLFGIIEFSAVLYNQAVITNASREAARYTSTYYINPENALAERPDCSDIQQFTVDYVKTHILSFTDPTPIIELINVTCPYVTPYNQEPSYAGYIDKITVDYTYDFLVFGGLIKLLNGDQSPLTLSATTVMRDENQGT